MSTSNRIVNANEDALEANCSPSDECEYDKTEYEDVDISKFKNLNDRLENWPDHDWRCGVHNGVKQEFSDNVSQALATYCDKYYDECNKHMINDVTSASSVPPTLYDESIFSPENAQTYGQQLIIYHHLMHQYNLRKYFDQATTNTPVPLPTQQTILCEGLPGVGKS